MDPDSDSQIELQKLVLTWGPTPKVSTEGAQPGFVSHSNRYTLAVETEFFKPVPEYLDADEACICVFGNPIVRDRIDRRAAAQACLDSQCDSRSILGLNGEFLIVHFDKVKNRLSVVNDRFTSVPFYFHFQEEVLIGSVAYVDLWLALKRLGKAQLRDETFFEMLWFRRVLGSKTLDTRSEFLPASHRLVLEGATARRTAYWRPDYTKATSRSLADSAVDLAAAIRSSIARKTSDGLRYGLFLSGGLDTRTILAAFDSPPMCFTATYRKAGNREYEVARRLAEIRSAKHVHLPLAADHFSTIIDPAVRQSGGMYQANSIFMGFRDRVASEVDAAFHGHGFDYMFQGMYIPAIFYQIGGVPLAKRIRPLGDNLLHEFVHRVSYRLRYPNLLGCVRPGHRDRFIRSITEEAQRILAQAEAVSDDPYDHWEFLTFHSLSRHYSYSDHASIHTNVEQRTISFDNEIYDLYLSLPLRHRFDARILRMTLRQLNPALERVRSANDGYPVTSFYGKAGRILLDKTLKGIGVKRRLGRHPTHYTRTWPTYEYVIRNEPRIKRMVERLGDSEALSALVWLDLEQVGEIVSAWIRDPNMPHHKTAGDFFWSLLTLDRFLALDGD